MRARFLLLGSLLLGCADAHSQAPADPCALATAMRDEALDSALASQPACTSDADCVTLSAAVSCGNIVELGDCGRAVHREVLQLYDAARVNDRICEAVQGSALGCALFTSCAASGAPVCRASRCVATPL